jgi:hypothetical protein
VLGRRPSRLSKTKIAKPVRRSRLLEAQKGDPCEGRLLCHTSTETNDVIGTN